MGDIDIQQFSKANNKFCGELYQKIIEEKQGNVVFSPISIQTVLSLAMFGASGETLNEMKNALNYGNISEDILKTNFQKLTKDFENSRGFQMANKICLMKKFSVKSEYNEIATKVFDSETESVDFKKNVEAAKNINKWVEMKTNDKIKDLIDENSLSEDTRIVLVNAVYFKRSWVNKFNPKNTQAGPFYLNETETIEVSYMQNKEHFRYGIFDNLDATAVALPYECSNTLMLIILPNSKTGLSALESKLNEIDFKNLLTKMQREEVSIKIPKFKIEFDIDLKESLQKMGMERLFSDAAEFDNLLNPPKPIKISKVIHKAFIEVDESGTEAAAATALMMCMCSGKLPPPPKYFHADRPFLFALILDSKVLFVGRKIQ